MLRVASGSAKGKKLSSLKSLRPTEEQVRNALFNSIGEKIKGKRFLDLFAGTGVVGIEALSRGASQAWFVDRARKCIELIRKNLQECRLEDRAKVFLTDARKAIRLFGKKGEKFHFVFLDPPYQSIDALLQSLELISEVDILEDEGVCIAQHLSGLLLPEEIGELVKEGLKTFGSTTLTFYRRKND